MRLIVDSACDLSLSYLEDHNIIVVPLSVIVEDKEYVDMFEIKNEQIYALIEEGKHPRTSQVPLEKFDTEFRKLAAEGESALYIALSSDLSGTYQAAVLASSQVKEDYPDFDLRIIDSRQASLGIGLLVREAVQMMADGFGSEEIWDRLTFMAKHVTSIFTVEDLKYLAEGGRLSKSSAFLGGLLNIHPLLEVVAGKLEPKEKFRGRKRVLNRMYERLGESSHLNEQTVLIVHTNDTETVTEMKNHIQATFGPKEIIDYPIGAVVAAHTGMGTLGLFFMDRYK